MNVATAISLPEQRPLAATRFTVPGMRCAGCIAKIERELPKTPGIIAARANFSAKRVAIEHDPAVDEAVLEQALLALGFEAQRVADNPLGNDAKERKQLTRALGVAGFGMMNVMLLSVSIWSGADGATKQLFHWLSALIALPVICLFGPPILRFGLDGAVAQAHQYGRADLDWRGAGDRAQHL
jgi:P-type Cu2+ transporter